MTLIIWSVLVHSVIVLNVWTSHFYFLTGLSIIKKNKAGKKKKKKCSWELSRQVSVRWKKMKDEEEAPVPFNKFSQFKPPNFYVKKSSCFAWGCYNGCFRYNLTAGNREAQKRGRNGCTRGLLGSRLLGCLGRGIHGRDKFEPLVKWM